METITYHVIYNAESWHSQALKSNLSADTLEVLYQKNTPTKMRCQVTINSHNN